MKFFQLSSMKDDHKVIYAYTFLGRQGWYWFQDYQVGKGRNQQYGSEVFHTNIVTDHSQPKYRRVLWNQLVKRSYGKGSSHQFFLKTTERTGITAPAPSYLPKGSTYNSTNLKPKVTSDNNRGKCKISSLRYTVTTLPPNKGREKASITTLMRFLD